MYVSVTGVVIYLLQGGFRLGIDFQGGVKLETRITAPGVTIQTVRKAFADDKREADVNTVGAASDGHYLITLPVAENSAGDEIQKNLDFLKKIFGQDRVVLQGSERVDSKIGRDFARRAVNLVLIAAGLIMAYIIFRFSFFYGLGAVITLFHDLAIMLSFCLFLRIPIDITVIAALLTVLGYSINDTIVVFDRIRENAAVNPEEDYALVIDKSITQTLSRTIITGLTTLFVVFAIYFWGGIVLRNFALLLLVGITVGTYSSIAIAAPATYMLRGRFGKKAGGKPKSA